MVQPISVTLPAFGSVIPDQGGIFAAILRGPTVDGVEQPPYALLISADTPTEHRWHAYAAPIPGAMSENDGLANTRDMLAAQCEAVLSLREGPIDEHNGWYLPSSDEIVVADANMPGFFRSGTVYWTSTQGPRQEAMCFLGDTMSCRSVQKSMRCLVRFFRRISLELLTPEKA